MQLGTILTVLWSQCSVAVHIYVNYLFLNGILSVFFCRQEGFANQGEVFHKLSYKFIR